MSQRVLCENEGGTLEARLEQETVWLTQEQIATLFQRDRTVIGRHRRRIFSEAEQNEGSNVPPLHTPPADKPTRLYCRHVTIAVGYRVKSEPGPRFRQWARPILKDHLTRGDALGHNSAELEAARPSVCGWLSPARKTRTSSSA